VGEQGPLIPRLHEPWATSGQLFRRSSLQLRITGARNVGGSSHIRVRRTPVCVALSSVSQVLGRTANLVRLAKRKAAGRQIWCRNGRSSEAIAERAGAQAPSMHAWPRGQRQPCAPSATSAAHIASGGIDPGRFSRRHWDRAAFAVRNMNALVRTGGRGLSGLGDCDSRLVLLDRLLRASTIRSCLRTEPYRASARFSLNGCRIAKGSGHVIAAGTDAAATRPLRQRFSARNPRGEAFAPTESDILVVTGLACN
jgi:hypothetical protein